MRMILGAVCVFAFGLCGCGGAPKGADEIKRKRDPRATPDNPSVEAVKPPAPPEDVARAAEVDASGLSAVEREAIQKMRAQEAAAKKANGQ